jgi:hypothetical protein
VCSVEFPHVYDRVGRHKSLSKAHQEERLSKYPLRYRVVDKKEIVTDNTEVTEITNEDFEDILTKYKETAGDILDE